MEGRSNKTMQKTIIQDRVSLLRPLAAAAPGAERTINFAVVYEDAAAHEWAWETYAQMMAGAGWAKVQSTWWKLDGLSNPAVLAGAVSKAMRADVIVVAVRTTEGFPLPFYVWAGSWLPHRLHDAGTLVALMATSKQPGRHTNRAAEYLRALAQRARMRFQFAERSLAAEAADRSDPES
jgi:hypothetical protein